MSEIPWLYVQNGAQHGPVSDGELRQMAASGRLQRGDLVWRAGMAQWMPAGQIPVLFQPGTAPLPGMPMAPIGYYAPQGGYPASHNMGQDAGMRLLLPVGRSGWAIAAGYVGLISVLAFPGPIAIILSIVAFMDMKKHPDRHGMGRAIFGLVMGILGTLFLGVWFIMYTYH